MPTLFAVVCRLKVVVASVVRNQAPHSAVLAPVVPVVPVRGLEHAPVYALACAPLVVSVRAVTAPAAAWVPVAH